MSVREAPLPPLAPGWIPLAERAARLVPGGTVSVGGVPGILSPAAIWVFALVRPPVFVVADDPDAEARLLSALRPSASPEVLVWGGTPEASAAAVIEAIAGRCPLVVIPPRALREEIPDPRGTLATLPLRAGMALDPDDLVAYCLRWGYVRLDTVEERGEFARRGGIVDVHPPGLPFPVRVDFVGDTVDSLRRFDPATQRSQDSLDEIIITPAEGKNLSRVPFPSLWAPAWTLVSGPLLSLPEGFSPARGIIAAGAGDVDLKGRPVAQVLPRLPGAPPRVGGTTEGMPGALAQALREALPGGVLLLARSERHRRGLEELFEGAGVPTRSLPEGAVPEALLFGRWPGTGSLATGVAAVPTGAAIAGGPLVITEEDLFGVKRPRPARRSPSSLAPLDLEIGDYVVHDDHGIGRFRGLVPIGNEGEVSDFVVLEYAGGDKVYLPVTRLDGLARYIGPEETPPAVDSLGGTRWRKARAKTEAAAALLAEELLSLYAGREIAIRPPYPPDGQWQREFEAAFEYIETEDQVRAIEEVKADMEAGRPMDRLVCGDVGYGKTEVAMRAAFKAVMAGHQVAVLVPTTILAMQHLQTFRARMERFPIRIEGLSRFTPRSQVASIRLGVEKGEVDILIGTHRILQRDIRFTELSLLVIDEEHRFGVRQKERIKGMRNRVDVLSLSATPIPRTLFMSLAGIRSLSLIDTPPEDRLPILTSVLPHSEEVIRNAVERELARGGQVFFVHNRIETLPEAEEALRRLLPAARIESAHGRMAEDDLEKILWRFFRRELDLLVSTAIVEAGLDVPTANTIIIDRADRFGLAQLYQLRGRVGRRGIQAYAFLLVRPDDEITDDGRRRLEILEGSGAEGGGYQLATWDLELRGTGNLLGAEQSGHMRAVGLEHYTRILRGAVTRLRGEAPGVEPILRLPGDAFLPESYIPDPHQRVAIYRRFSAAAGPAEVAEIREELCDRFGPIPPPVALLLEVVAIKAEARAMGIAFVEYRHPNVQIGWEATLFPGREALEAAWSGDPRAQFLPPSGCVLSLTPRDAPVTAAVLRFLRLLRSRLPALTFHS